MGRREAERKMQKGEKEKGGLIMAAYLLSRHIIQSDIMVLCINTIMDRGPGVESVVTIGKNTIIILYYLYTAHRN